jgi:hypothetical protein
MGEKAMSVIDAAGAIRANTVPSRYPVNLRFSVPFLPRAFFITFIAGVERRAAVRLRQERARHPVNTWGNLTILVTSWVVLNVAALFVALMAMNF